LAAPYSLAQHAESRQRARAVTIAELLQCHGKKTVIAEGEKEETQREGQPCEWLDVPEESRAGVRHDSWVVGDEPYVSLHFMGAGKYAKAKK
jgi:hypothetical protein